MKETTIPNALSNFSISKKQLEKLLAINNLMTIAKYLNDGWQPNWRDDSKKYYIQYNNYIREIDIAEELQRNVGTVYFKSETLAKKAIEILGEEIIELALCTDY